MMTTTVVTTTITAAERGKHVVVPWPPGFRGASLNSNSPGLVALRLAGLNNAGAAQRAGSRAIANSVSAS